MLYPFISLWMVGGRISPSFTSALSMELSNNLRTKTEKGKGGEKTEIRMIFFFFFYQVDFSSQPPHCSHNLQGADWVPWQIVQTLLNGRRGRRLKLKTQNWKMKNRTITASFSLCSFSRSPRNWVVSEYFKPSFFHCITYAFKITAIMRFFSPRCFWMLSLKAHWSVGSVLYCWQLCQRKRTLIAASPVVCGV